MRLVERALTESPQGQGPGYKERMEKLTTALAGASAEVDKILEEIATVSRAREDAMKELELRLKDLGEREKELNARVESLKNVPLPAIEYFVEATAKGEKRSALRDYILFGLGVVASTVLSVVLKLLFGV